MRRGGEEPLAGQGLKIWYSERCHLLWVNEQSYCHPECSVSLLEREEAPSSLRQGKGLALRVSSGSAISSSCTPGGSHPHQT